PELGAHADGTILVLADNADAAVVDTAIEQLSDAGAPVLGYVRNRSTGTAALAPHRARSAIMRAGLLAVLVVLAYALYTGAQLLWSWNQLETAALETAAVEDLVSQGTTDGAAAEDSVELPDEEEAPAESPAERAPTEAYETMLIIGSDEIAGASDVVMYLVRPTNGADPFIVSLPRDLYVDNPCTGGNSRINVLIKGCPAKDINGPSLLAYQVGAITGIEVDHFASFNFDGFIQIIDAVGGIEICHEYPVRDEKAHLNMDAGCTQATGEQALSWVRSRKTQQYVNGSWKSVPGASDLQRNQHQQEVIIDLFTKLKTFDSVGQLTTKAASLSDTFLLDEGLSLTGAVELAWGLRAIELDTIRRLELPVRLTTSKSGQSILVATVSFDEVLLDEYGSGLPTEDGELEETTAAGL
ncbi:MAG: LCP family protein, partial [Acidimicrobiia bacterium]